MTEEERKENREYMKKYNATEKGAEYNRRHVKEWRKRNPEKRKEQVKKESTSDKIYNLRKHLKATYGITVEDFNQMFKSQEGKCAICFRHQTEFKRRLSVDHNHSTGKVRQLLCSNCNHFLGSAKENIDIMKSAISYLEKHTGY